MSRRRRVHLLQRRRQIIAPPPVISKLRRCIQAFPRHRLAPRPLPAVGSYTTSWCPVATRRHDTRYPLPQPCLPPVPRGVATPLGAAVPVGRDYLRITPDRILAPVGSEVVLKAGICSAQGYLVANQRVEWLLSPSGTGEFVDLGERDQVTLFRPIWDTPTKFDNSYAITSTSFMPVCLDRGTPEPTDDVQILKGDAWITVTSARKVPATSPRTHQQSAIGICAVRSPRSIGSMPNGRCRRRRWWKPGRPHVLTTTVMRRTDGAPLAGWLVRYDIGGGASLGYEGGNVVEVPTDAAGRASAEVSPANVGGGSSTVWHHDYPATAGRQGSESPARNRPRGRDDHVDDGSHRAAAGYFAIYTRAGRPRRRFRRSAPSLPGPSLDSTPQPTLPNTPAPAGGYSPPPDAPPPGQARLDVQTTAGKSGTSCRRRIRALSSDGHEPRQRHRTQHSNSRPFRPRAATPGSSSQANLKLFLHEHADLPPNESETMALTFEVVAGGNQCHEVTVTAQGAEPARATGCVTGAQAALTVTATGPRTHIVDEIAEFRATIQKHRRRRGEKH